MYPFIPDEQSPIILLRRYVFPAHRQICEKCETICRCVETARAKYALAGTAQIMLSHQRSFRSV